MKKSSFQNAFLVVLALILIWAWTHAVTLLRVDVFPEPYQLEYETIVQDTVNVTEGVTFKRKIRIDATFYPEIHVYPEYIALHPPSVGYEHEVTQMSGTVIVPDCDRECVNQWYSEMEQVEPAYPSLTGKAEEYLMDQYKAVYRYAIRNNIPIVGDQRVLDSLTINHSRR